MTRLFLLPGENYAGPFNPIDRAYRAKYPPRDELDRAALEHDLAYKAMGSKAYFKFNAADQKFLDSIEGIPGVNASIARGFFRGKRALNVAFDKVFHPNSKRRVVEEVPSDDSDIKLNMSVYRGPFRRPAYTPRVDVYDKYGYKSRKVIDGVLSESGGLLGVGLRSFVPHEMASNVGASLLRHLLKKHYRIDITHPSQEVFAYQWALVNTATTTADMPQNPTTGALSSGVPDPLTDQVMSFEVPQATDVYDTSTIEAQYTFGGIRTPTVSAIAFYVEQKSGFLGNEADTAALPVDKRVFDGSNEVQKYVTRIAGQKNADNWCVFKFAADTTLQSFGQWFGHKVCSGAFGDAENQNISIKGYQFFHLDYWKTNSDFAGGVPAQNHALIRPQGFQPLDGMFIKASSVVHMKFQNRTRSDSMSNEVNVVDSNPLRVCLHHHNSPLPVQRDPRQQMTVSANAPLFVFEDSNLLVFSGDKDDGIIVGGGGGEAPTGDGIDYQTIDPAAETAIGNYNSGYNKSRGPFVDIPPPHAFRTVTRVGYDKFDPGEIKTHSISFKFDGLLSKFCHGLKEIPSKDLGTDPVYPNTMSKWKTSIAFAQRCMGTCDMLWFTHMLRWAKRNNDSGAATYDQEINIAFEVERTTWSRVKKVKNTAFITEWQGKHDE